MNNKTNHLAVWILVVAHQLIGFGWYAMFGELWLSYHAKTMTDIERTHDFVPYLIAIAASIAVNYALAWLIKGLNATSATTALKISVLCWFAFLFVNTRLSRRPLPSRQIPGPSFLSTWAD